VIQAEETLIRPAREGDGPGIANVHISSWRDAYKGLLPQDFLDKLPLDCGRRMGWWQKVISEPDNFVLRVAESKKEIIGFACFQAGRDQGMESLAEMGAIYVFERFKGRKIGFSLLSSGFKQMKERGFRQGYCWVLEGNPTIKFYERSGAVFSGQTKDDEIGGQVVRELAYRWDSLDFG
jgi:ribosomal protein S18 acetylase RimI-like enzyme